jgi:hypothetical protein
MSKPVMTDKDVIDLVRKEFERKIDNYCKKNGIEKEKNEDDTEDMQKTSAPNGKKSETLEIKSLIKSIGLRILHKDSGLEYYIRGVNTATGIVNLETPEGNLFQVDFDEIEKDYKLG